MGKKLTIDDLYDPDRKIDFDGAPQPDAIWLDDDHFIQRFTNPKTQSTEWLKVHAGSGNSAPFYDPLRMESSLKQLPGLSGDDAKRLARLPNYVMNPAKTAVVLNHGNNLFYYHFDSGRALRLTAAAASEVGEEFSPDGRLVSFIRDYNLYIVDVETLREWALTGDGNVRTLNGRLDWVYQEEIYGRGNFKGYWWSPDSNRIAYLRLDESPLKPYPVTDHIPYRPDLEVTNYPLAGDPNPKVRLGIVSVLGARRPGSTRSGTNPATS